MALKINFTYLAHFMPSHAVSIEKNIIPDSPVEILGESYFAVVQCNNIDNAEGTLRLNVKPTCDSQEEIKVIIPLRWGKQVEYKDDLISVLSTVYPLLNQ